MLKQPCVQCVMPTRPVDVGDGETFVLNGTDFVSIFTKGNETRKLPMPKFLGQSVILAFQDDFGDCLVQSTGPLDEMGHTRILFTAVGQVVGLIASCMGSGQIPSMTWKIMFNNGAELLVQ